MSNNISASNILDLLEISKALTPEKKLWWKAQLPKMNDFQKTELVKILESEAKAIIDNLKKKVEIKKRYAHKKIKALYEYIEGKIEQEEEIELSLLDKELENV